MVGRISELQYKELVDISDGTRYGYIGDLEVDSDTGMIRNIVVYGRARVFGLLGRQNDLILPWSAIKRIGPDIILVEWSGKEKYRDNLNFS